MKFFVPKKIYEPKKEILRHFIKRFWFIPSDVLQRSIESNIWDLCTFKRPVLDIGIGNGAYTKLLFRKHKRFSVGIDNEKEGLEMAKTSGMYSKVLWADASQMPFKDATFNTVVSNSTFEHIEKDLQSVSEVSRVLKKNGLFFVTVPSNFLQQWILEYEKKSDQANAKQKLAKFNLRANHLHYRSLNEWKTNLSKNDMELIFYKYYFPKNVALYWYKMFKLFTIKILGREIWSYLSHSRITKLLPRKIIMNILETKILKKYYNRAFLMESGEGAQLFILAKKNK